MLRVGPGRPEFGDEFDFADDVLVQFFQALGGNPEFAMMSVTHLLYGKLLQEVRPHLESSDISRVTGLLIAHVPLLRNLSRISFVQDGIENWLVRQAGRELSELAGAG